jgi:hypothetical protein
MTREEITSMVKAIGDLMTVLSEADPPIKPRSTGSWA